ncbi:MAG: competence/damage-inducible protein A [Bacteroidales bacterium]|nr:competence/damage-inducible protein A [Bacteroidales bacterium]
MVKVAIINIGDELLIGQVVNTNAAEMAKMLNAAGFDVVLTQTIGDDGETIRKFVVESLANSDVVLVTGGLGPTKDDITKKVLAEIFDSELVENVEVREHIKKMFVQRGYAFTPTNQEQALVPKKCRVIFNAVGTAPGMCFEKEGKLLFSLPGVPFEMRTMMKEVIRIMEDYFETEVIEHRTLMFAGIGESFLSDMLEDFEATLPAYMKLAYLPQPGMLRLRLTAKGTSKKLILSEIENRKEALRHLAQDYFIGYEMNSLAEAVGEKLVEVQKTMATAESCTGGNIAHQITLIPGSSRYFKGTVVSYANEVKQQVLGVNACDLEKYGAVSEQVAKQMAQGVRQLLQVDYAVATTGIAGPDGGTEEKPVGTVWIAFADANGCHAEKYCYASTRESFIDRVSNYALLMLLKKISAAR